MGLHKTDLTGKKFGDFTVIREIESYTTPSGKTVRNFICRCDCGNEKVIKHHLLSPNRKPVCEKCRSINRYDLSGEYGKGYIRNGAFLFDLEDYDRIKSYSWHELFDGTIGAADKGKYIRLHRLVTEADDNVMITHINGDKRDNRKCNLKKGKYGGNRDTRQANSNSRTGHKGVCRVDRLNRYAAYIYVDNKQINLGVFKTLEEAVAARKNAEAEYFGTEQASIGENPKSKLSHREDTEF